MIKKYCLDDNFQVGDLVEADFDNNFVYTFTRASETHQGALQGDGPQFYKDDIGLVIGVISTPESFYSIEFCKLLFRSGATGWLPSRWLCKVDNDKR
jgi:hypothetical protein